MSHEELIRIAHRPGQLLVRASTQIADELYASNQAAGQPLWWVAEESAEVLAFVDLILPIVNTGVAVGTLATTIYSAQSRRPKTRISVQFPDGTTVAGDDVDEVSRLLQLLRDQDPPAPDQH